MQDNEYLGRVVDAVKLLHANECISVYNANFEIVYSTFSSSHLILGKQTVKRSKILYGRSFSQIPHPTAEFSDYYRSIITRTNSMPLFTGDNYFNEYDELVPCIIASVPTTLINPESKNLVGFIGTYKLNPELSIKQLYALIDEASFKLGDKSTHDADLTPRQQHVLILLLKNMSAKEIALFLSEVEGRLISHMTIHQVINVQLFKKFDVNSVSQLKQKVFSTNYHGDLIRTLLFKKGFLIK